MASRTPRRMRGGMEKSIADELAQKLAKPLSIQVRNAAVEICNGLSEAGPAWSGRFSASWDVVPLGGTPRQRNVPNLSMVYEYSYRNFPLKIFEGSILNMMRNGTPVTWDIVNTTDYAAQAIDEAEGYFIRPSNNPFPIGEIVDEGFRPYSFADMMQEEHLRWQLSSGPGVGNPEEPDSSITAEKDWFSTYTLGGRLQVDLSRGMRIQVSGLPL